ncbi:glycosyltransferase family 28 domain-containing protein [Zalerion maritima]|uniref:Glycosyltransferase family 28 domain-containing protein n=1 Tax=Zalerion maritima TaxID=339359 RepID=A0AAD5RIX1_9PEZI|nr:glycosyltransferase family 28 domain-containing protein [Zalerion maritima]
MTETSESREPQGLQQPTGHHRREASDALVSSGFDLPEMDAPEEASPPAYGDVMDELHLSQSGFEAGAAIAADGRINITIREKNRRLADLLAPTLRNQLVEEGDRRQEPLPPAYVPPALGGQPGQTPPPKMNVAVQIVGSRGDVQPFVALGKVLHETYGHRVRIATHPTFQKFIEDNGLEFFSIGGDPAELMAFMVKHPGLMPGFDALKNGEVKQRRKGMEEMLMGCWRSCIETGNGLGPPPPSHPRNQSGTEISAYGSESEKPFVADVIIANPPSFAHIHVAEKLGVPLHMMFTMPWSATRAFPHPLANIQSTETDVTMTNYTSYALVEMMTWQGLGDVINRFRIKALDLEPLSLIWAPGLLTRLRIPYTYCWSPALIPKPNDWGNNIDISGFYFLNLASAYTPEPELAEFLANGPPPVYIGFGSIVVDDPNALTRTIFDAVSAAGVRALVSKGWGGLGADSVGLPDGVFMLGNCPHDWLFKHISAVVHHGGAGTTAAGINAGKPTVVVPFFGDQPFWGSMIHKAGAGPAPIPNKTLNADNLAEALRECMKPETQARAQELGEKIRQEKGCDVGGMKFHDHLDLDKLRCSFAPSRIAIWRVRRTQIRLSAFAAAVLLKEGQVQLTDLKLYRSKEYDTEEQPWDPISAVTASLVADMASIGMGIAEMPWGVYKAASSRSKSFGQNSFQGGSQKASHTSDVASNTTTTPSVVKPSNASMLSGRSDVVPPSPSATTTSVDHSTTSSILSSKRERNTSSPSLGITSAKPSTTSLGAESMHTQETPRSAGGSHTPSQPAEAGPSNPEESQFNVENMVQTGRGVGRIVETGMKTPLNFCMGLARGFRNVPKLYNDDTIRPAEKVTDMSSGLKVAGKELGLGFYDGISGLVTQPLRGAKKDGARGLVTGFGKGIGGLVMKPAAGIWGVPAYAMAGVHAEIRSKTAKSMHNYIVASRLRQGEDDYQAANPTERADIVRRWQATSHKEEIQPFYRLKGREIATQSKERKERKDKQVAESSRSPTRGSKLLQKGMAHLGSTLDQQKAQWLQKRGMSPNALGGANSILGLMGGSAQGLAPSTSTSTTATSTESSSFSPTSTAATAATTSPKTSEDEEFERAIQASVRETSSGNPDEDAMIEQAIRASVAEARKGRAEPNSSTPTMGPGYDLSASPQVGGFAPSTGEETSTTAPSFKQPQQAELEGSSIPPRYELEGSSVPPRYELDSSSSQFLKTGVNPNDTLTAEDMQITDEEYQKLIGEAIQKSMVEQREQYVMSSGVRRHSQSDSDEDEELRRILEESAAEQAAQGGQCKGKQAEVPDEEDDELQRAIEESKIQGSSGPAGGGGGMSQEEDEEQLRRVIEESKADAADMREDEIVMEYVKRQSMAEEAYRQRVAKGKMPEGATREDEDEELQRAMAESLRMSQPEGDGTSH